MAIDKSSFLVRRPNLVESVQNAILEAIQRNEFKVGECLPTEQALSAMYGVSRPTIREAMIRLRAKNPFLSRRGHRTHVDAEPEAGALALAFDDISCIEDFKRCYEFRRNVEAGAARFAALNRNNDDIDMIQQAFHQLHGHSDTEETEEMPVHADFAFHMAIASATGNRVFLMALESIRGQSLFIMDLSRKFSRPQQMQRMEAVEEEHRSVLESIVRKDPTAAATAMQLHIDRSTSRVLGGCHQLNSCGFGRSCED